MYLPVEGSYGTGSKEGRRHTIHFFESSGISSCCDSDTILYDAIRIYNIIWCIHE